MRVSREFDFVLSHLEWLHKEFESPIVNQEGNWQDKREILHHFSSVLGNSIFKIEECFCQEELNILRECYTHFLENSNMLAVISKMKDYKNYEYQRYN